jgi:hypothetical protein
MVRVLVFASGESFSAYDGRAGADSQQVNEARV